jgi:hypothetical protein
VHASAGSGEVVLLEDDFDDNALDTAKWDTTDLFSGTEDVSIAVTETNGRIQIGPLREGLSGSQYNGIDSQLAYDFTGAAAAVELVQPASASAVAYAMFTVGIDSQKLLPPVRHRHDAGRAADHRQRQP